MREFLLIGLFIILFAGLGFSQNKNEKPNLSGMWIFNQTESNKLFTIDSSGLSVLKCSIKKEIEHHDPELKIKTISECQPEFSKNKLVDKYETVKIYYTDTRGEINKTSKGSLISSETKWDKNKLVIYEYLVNPQNQKRKLLSITELSISKNKEQITEKSALSKEAFDTTSTLGGRWGSVQKMVFKLLK